MEFIPRLVALVRNKQTVLCLNRYQNAFENVLGHNWVTHGCEKNREEASSNLG